MDPYSQSTKKKEKKDGGRRCSGSGTTGFNPTIVGRKSPTHLLESV
jgi:hypothetical protein